VFAVSFTFLVILAVMCARLCKPQVDSAYICPGGRRCDRRLGDVKTLGCPPCCFAAVPGAVSWVTLASYDLYRMGYIVVSYRGECH